MQTKLNEAIRTPYLRIFSPLLYQLSYPANLKIVCLYVLYYQSIRIFIHFIQPPVWQRQCWKGKP